MENGYVELNLCNAMPEQNSSKHQVRGYVESHTQNCSTCNIPYAHMLFVTKSFIDLQTVETCPVLAASRPDMIEEAANQITKVETTNDLVNSVLLNALRRHRRDPPLMLKADQSGKYVAHQKDLARPGQDAALRP